MDRRDFLRNLGMTAAGVAIASWSTGMAVRARDRRPLIDVPRHIRSDGSRDVTTALTRFIQSAPEGSTVRLARGGRYRIEDTVLIADRHDLVLEGNDATLFATTVGTGNEAQLANRSHLKLERVSDVGVRNLRVIGVNPNPGVFTKAFNSQHGIHLSGVQGVRVRRCIVSNVFGDSIYLGNRECLDVRVIENRCTGSGRQGMTLIWGSNVTFMNNFVGNTGFTAFDFEQNSTHQLCSGIYVVNNEIGRGGAAWLAAKGRAPCNDVHILGNRSSTRGLGIQAGTEGHRHSSWEIAGNVSSVASKHSRLLGFVNMDNVLIARNDLPVQRGGVAVTVNGCANVQVMDNRFAGALKVLDERKPGMRFYFAPSVDCYEANNII